MTASVVGAIAPKLEQAEIERAKRKPTESLDAYDYFLRGMADIYRWTRVNNDQALTLFYKANSGRSRRGGWLGWSLLTDLRAISRGGGRPTIRGKRWLARVVARETRTGEWYVFVSTSLCLSVFGGPRLAAKLNELPK